MGKVSSSVSRPGCHVCSGPSHSHRDRQRAALIGKLISQGGIEHRQGQIAPRGRADRTCRGRRSHHELVGREAGGQAGPANRGHTGRWRRRRGRPGRARWQERSMRTPWRPPCDAPVRHERRCPQMSAPPIARRPASPQASFAPPETRLFLPVWHSAGRACRMLGRDRVVDSGRAHGRGLQSPPVSLRVIATARRRQNHRPVQGPVRPWS